MPGNLETVNNLDAEATQVVYKVLFDASESAGIELTPEQIKQRNRKAGKSLSELREMMRQMIT